MTELKFIQEKYPSLFARLEKELPSGFFTSPYTASSNVKRKYNNLLSNYIIEECGDFGMLNHLQLIISA